MVGVSIKGKWEYSERRINWIRLQWDQTSDDGTLEGTSAKKPTRTAAKYKDNNNNDRPPVLHLNQ